MRISRPAAAKGILKRIDTLVSTLITTITYTINATMRTVVNLVKQYEKELFDMLYGAVFGEGKSSFWCNRLWKCAALLAELLDSDSWLNQKVRRALERKCRSTASLDVMDLIAQSITDFGAFQQTVCDALFHHPRLRPEHNPGFHPLSSLLLSEAYSRDLRSIGIPTESE